MSDNYFEEEEYESKFNGKTFVRILGLPKPYIWWVVAFLLCVAGTSILDGFFTYLTKQMIDIGIAQKNLPYLHNRLVIYGVIALAQSAFVFGFLYFTMIMGEKIRYDIRRKLFNHLQTLSLSYYSKTPVGWIMSRVTSDSDRVAEIVTWGFVDSAWGLVNILTAFGFMFYINAKLALIILAIIPILLTVATIFQRRILEQYRNVRKMNSKITAAINENISGVRIVKALGREDKNLKEFSVLTGNMRNASYRAAWLSALFLPTVQIIAAIGLGTVVWYGGVQTQYGNMTVGDIQAFVSYVTFMIWPIQDLARVFAEMQHSIASAERIFSLMDAVPEVHDLEQASPVTSLHGTIEFEDVSFHYSDGDGKNVLEDFSLTIDPGETIALVGSTGGGKSTIVNLLCRFFETTKGSIRFNGTDYRDFTLNSIQSKIGVVLQTPHLFSGSIMENLRYGKLDATDEEILAASKLVGADNFIHRFENGYNENVGEGGNLLSVGQKQLISLARAILAEPELFIMDEATSSVDTLTEQLIQKGMESIMKDRTSVVIAHRLSTIRKAHRILVIEDGKIAEIGSHAELLRKRGKYFHLYTNQFRQEMEQSLDPLSGKPKTAEGLA
ncbi:MAG TPA: ABC transporter ATP-binding protein [Bellilinea sp.]|nr:ABC transporter ATP-binding protein [Bellilinea sp.]